MSRRTQSYHISFSCRLTIKRPRVAGFLYRGALGTVITHSARGRVFHHVTSVAEEAHFAEPAGQTEPVEGTVFARWARNRAF